jgi:prepilin-type N-terminal cleavage/methylation domain-containing protein
VRVYIKETNASRLSLLNLLALNGLPMRYTRSGFTLVELMVAAAASLILTSIAFASLLTFQQMSQKQDEKATQKAELQRALNFIASDIQEGKSIQDGAPTLPDHPSYQGLFQIVRPDPDTLPIGYYTVPKGTHVWAGPQIIFRRDFNKPIEDPYALIDQISNQSPRECLSNPSDTLYSTGVGATVAINPQKTKATICLVGHLRSSNKGMEAFIQATTRSK